MQNTLTVTPKSAIKALTTLFYSKLVPLMTGSPGIGKSGITAQLAKTFNLKLIDVRLSTADITDLTGFPKIDGGKAGYVPMDTFPIEGDQVPDGYDGWLLLFDELTSANLAMQAASYKIILDRMVGQYKLHDKVVVAAAGNLATDNAVVEEMSTALQSRMIHLVLECNTDEWLEWAMENNFNHLITSFIKFRPDLIHNFKPDHSDHTYACPRTWEFVNKLLNNIEITDPLTYTLLSGTVGMGAASEFLTFTKCYKDLPTLSQMTSTPSTCILPTEPGSLYALTGYIASNVNVDTVGDYMPYVTRMPAEFQVVCIKQMLQRTKEIISAPAVQKWVAINAKELV